MSTLSLIPEEKKYLPNTSKSTESLYSSSSSKYSATALYRRKVAANRQPGYIPVQNEVRQRVLSARRLRMKTLQNQLADAHQHIAELANENRVLRTLHKRQDSALSKYEGTSAELPQLLHSHAEEIRIWQAKYRNLQGLNRDLSRKLKDREAMLLALGDQNKHLTQLSKEKNLEERDSLTERVRYLEHRLNEKDNDLKLLARRLQLEAKNFKAQLYKEQQKYKQLIHKLDLARIDPDKLLQFDVKERPSKPAMIRSLSGSKLPKPIKERERGYMRNERENDAKSSSSTPSLCQEYQTIPPINNLKEKINPNNNNILSKQTDVPKIVQSQNKLAKESRQPSGGRKSRKDNDTNYDSVDLSKAISMGMSKLLRDDDSDKDKVSLSGNENQSDPENILDQSEPENYYEDNYKDQFGNGDDYLGYDEDNDSSADVIVAGSMEETYHSEEVIHQTRIDLESIRKQINEDYKQRETFLDTFCRQSSDLEKDLSGRRSKHIDSAKKSQLLAALKAIDSEEGVQ